MLYHSLVLPYLNYGVLVWGISFHKFVKLQKKAVRLVVNANFNAHTEPLFKELKLLKATDILKLQELRFMFKLENHLLPYYFQASMFRRRSEFHEYKTRRRNDYTKSRN